MLMVGPVVWHPFLGVESPSFSRMVLNISEGGRAGVEVRSVIESVGRHQFLYNRRSAMQQQAEWR